jgi:hypothetical protein
MAGPTQLFANNAVSLLAAPIGASDIMLTVMAGHGAMFPQPTNNGADFFLITLENQAASVREIIRVGARYGDTFTNLTRGREGTPALAWSASIGNDTLVDHRVTAETMRQAMLLPEAPVVPPGGITGIGVQKEGVAVGAEATTLNFTGLGVTVVGAGSTKTIDIQGGSSSATVIQGANTLTPITVLNTATTSTSNAGYSQYQRGFKFFVTLYNPIGHQSSTFEVLGNVSGNIAGNAETVSFNRTARVGFNFAGSVDIILNKTTKQLDLVWTNLEPVPVEVMCTRIQHLP